MSRHVPIVITGLFVAAAVSAEAHSLRPHPVTRLVLADGTSQPTAFSGLSTAQETDDGVEDGISPPQP